MKRKSISAEEFDRLFDEGGDISPYVDWSKARRPNLETRRVNVDLPEWMIAALDAEARQRGITRQAVIKTWIFDKIREQTAVVTDEEDRARMRPKQLAEPRGRALAFQDLEIVAVVGRPGIKGVALLNRPRHRLTDWPARGPVRFLPIQPVAFTR